MKLRGGLAMLMGIVALIALGLGLMRSPSDGAVSASYGVMLVVSSVGLIGSIVRRDGAIVGFTVFGWLHASLALVPVDKLLDLPVLPTVGLVDAFADRLIPRPADPPALPANLTLWSHGYVVLLDSGSFRLPTPAEQKIVDQVESWKEASSELRSHLIPDAQRIDYMAMTLLVAIIGSGAGRLLDDRSRHTNTLLSAPQSNPVV